MPYDAGDDSSFGPLVSERFFISDSILDNNDCGLVLVNGRSYRLDSGILINSLVSTDDVIISLTSFSGVLCRSSLIDLSEELGLDRVQGEQRTLALTAS